MTALETYMKHHISELRDLGIDIAKKWVEGSEQWCKKHHGMSCVDYYNKLDAKRSTEVIKKWLKKEHGDE